MSLARHARAAGCAAGRRRVAARAAATLADLRYRSGLVDFQNVLQTQRTLAACRGQPGRHHHHAGHRPRAPVQGAGRRLDPRHSERRTATMSTPDPALDAAARPRRRAAPLVAPPHALGRAGAAGGRRRRRLVLARPAPGRSAQPQYTDAGGDARRADRHRHRQRHAAADHPGRPSAASSRARWRACTSTSTTASRRARCWSSWTTRRCATRSPARAPRWPRPRPCWRRPAPPPRRRATTWRGCATCTGAAAARCRRPPSWRPPRPRAARGEANVASAQANVAEARAALSADETNLAKASIRSPIDGVVLSRSVDPGNAVAASLQAVTLFTLAEDLTKMKLQVNVDEADVGQVQERAGRHASPSAPTRTAATRHASCAWATARRPRTTSSPTSPSCSVDNDDLSLRPGMTATATITTVERSDVLLVPNAALRFTPATAAAAAAPRPATASCRA